MKKKRIVVANWKMNPQDPGEAKRIFLGIRKEVLKLSHVLTVVCPPVLYLSQLRKLSSETKMALGAQMISEKESGAYTGEISAPMVKNMGADYVIVGHSEARTRGETLEMIVQKAKLALEDGLTPIVCVGEMQRDDQGTHFEMLRGDIAASVGKLSKKQLSAILIAYEPRWAIGKSASEALSAQGLEETVLFIRKVLAELFGREEALKATILYGGSVEPSNAGALIERGGVDGFLVGHKSLHPGEFGQILRATDVL